MWFCPVPFYVDLRTSPWPAFVKQLVRSDHVLLSQLHQHFKLSIWVSSSCIASAYCHFEYFSSYETAVCYVIVQTPIQLNSSHQARTVCCFPSKKTHYSERSETLKDRSITCKVEERSPTPRSRFPQSAPRCGGPKFLLSAFRRPFRHSLLPDLSPG